MGKLSLVHIVAILILGLALTCNATTYTVGDSSGWDISSDLDSWAVGKTFAVGDVLWFQYSSQESVSEVKRENYNTCNTSNALFTGRGGNTSIPLTRPGQWYFISGNKLLCLGGEKLEVNVQDDHVDAPASAPQAQTGSLRPPSSKSNNPTVPTSAGFRRRRRDSFVVASLGFFASFMLVVYI